MTHTHTHAHGLNGPRCKMHQARTLTLNLSLYVWISPLHIWSHSASLAILKHRLWQCRRTQNIAPVCVCHNQQIDSGRLIVVRKKDRQELCTSRSSIWLTLMCILHGQHYNGINSKSIVCCVIGSFLSRVMNENYVREILNYNVAELCNSHAHSWILFNRKTWRNLHVLLWWAAALPCLRPTEPWQKLGDTHMATCSLPASKKKLTRVPSCQCHLSETHSVICQKHSSLRYATEDSA